MRIPGRRYRDEWLPNFYPSREVADGHWLRLSRTGRTVTLSREEDQQLDEVYMDEAVFARLERTGHIITPANAARVFEELKTWHQVTYSGPALFIVVLTKRCNLDCTYCHMNPEPVQADRGTFDLQPDVALEIIRFALGSPNPIIVFEFQGGEPFLNFPAMVHFVREARRMNQAAGKDLRFVAVSNLMVINDEQLRFCRDEEIRLSYTLNGPAPIHDHYRKTRRGLGSYSVVMERLDDIQARYPGLVSAAPLCVIDGQNADKLEEMIDFFHDAGFGGLALIRLKHLGNARRGQLDLDIHEFLRHYTRGLDYIFAKNRNSSRVFIERMLPVALEKIFGDSDVGFVDWRNPCGDVSGSITFDHDGEILPNDDARSLRSEFSLGNVRGLSYDALVRRKESFRSMNLSLRDRDAACRECAYNPYCGVLPVLEFARGGDATPRPHESEECLFTIALLSWTFKKLLTEPLPLVRMLPGMGAHLKKLLEAKEERRPEAGAAEPAAPARPPRGESAPLPSPTS